MGMKMPYAALIIAHLFVVGSRQRSMIGWDVRKEKIRLGDNNIPSLTVKELKKCCSPWKYRTHGFLWECTYSL